MQHRLPQAVPREPNRNDVQIAIQTLSGKTERNRSGDRSMGGIHGDQNAAAFIKLTSTLPFS
jgi:hypothetical protein